MFPMSSEEPIEDPWARVVYFRYQQLSEYTSIPENTLRSMVAEGIGPPSFPLNPSKPKSTRLFAKADVEAWLKEKRDAAGSD